MRIPGFTAASSLRSLSAEVSLLSGFMAFCSDLCVKAASDCSDRCGDDGDCENACVQSMLNCFDNCSFWDIVISFPRAAQL